MIRFARERVTRATLTSPTWTALRAHFLPRAAESRSGRVRDPFFARRAIESAIFLCFESISSVPLSRSGDYTYIRMYVCVCNGEGEADQWQKMSPAILSIRSPSTLFAYPRG